MFRISEDFLYTMSTDLEVDNSIVFEVINYVLLGLALT